MTTMSNVMSPKASPTKQREHHFLTREDRSSTSKFLMVFFFVKFIFCILDEKLLEGCVKIKNLPIGTTVIKQDSVEDAMLIYVLTGSLNVSQKVVDKDDETHLFVAYPGELIGALAVLTGEPSFFSVTVRHPSVIGVISKNELYDIMRLRPRTVLNVAHSIVQRLSPFVRQIDFSLDWIHIESGRALYRQGEKSDCTYVVLSGRLRSVITHKNGKKELVGEYGRGDLVGIVELTTQTERSTTVMAVRATELAKLPEGLLNSIKVKYPVVVTRLIHLLGQNILGSWQKTGINMTSVNTTRAVNVGSNFATVAILPASDDVPLSPFTLELYHSLSAIGPTFRLTNEIVRRILGPTILDSSNDYRLCTWLAQQEDHHRIVLYQCDTNFTPWTQHCIRQSDLILIVAKASNKPSIGKIEKQLENIAVRTQKELVLLHREDAKKPRNTVEWLNMRSWCSSHHHIKCPNRMFTKKSQFRIVEMYNKVFENPPSIHSDFSRLARFLTGTSIGLVLGGGGARGAAHVGMIKAIQESGIPIDMVGGVSIGAFMGGLWCEEKNLTSFVQRAREWSLKMTSVWRQILDLTYPATAMFTGAAFNRCIEDVFKDIQIEDLWLPYYTVTTDITDSVMRVHTHGSLWRYVRSSMSLSGYLPPLCDPTDGHLLLDGGYINNLPASMSIAGVLPPVCDPDDGHLLVDGAYVNIVPADIMKTMGAQTILAIDVGSQDETNHTNYGDTLSGWWLLWKKWNPWAEPVKVPSLPEIQSRLAYVSCMRQLELVKRSDYCEYIRPPIDKYKTLQFGSFDEIMEVGYNHGKKLLSTDRAKELIQVMKTVKGKQSMGGLKNSSFTDLAEMVCRIEEPSRTYLTDSSDEYGLEEETKEGYASEPDHIMFNADESDHSPVRRRRQLSLGGFDSFSAPES
ncbi:Neuropathy target esterase sws [Nymphon striatum]|nr:Neuropathy target esterase sws [Nymphon striatum]